MGRKKKGNGQAKAYDDTLSEVSDMMSMSSYQTNRSDGESDPDIIGKIYKKIFKNLLKCI